MRTHTTKNDALKMGKIGRQYGLARQDNPFDKHEEKSFHEQWLNGFVDMDSLIKHGEPLTFDAWNRIDTGAQS